MNICILTHTFPRFDGDTAAPFMDGVAGSLVSSKNNIFVLTPYSKYFKKTNKEYKIITYKYIYPDFLHKLGYSETLTDDRSLKPLMFLLSPLMIFFGILALYKLIKREKIEIVNAHWILPNGFMAGIVSLFTKIKVISTLPGSDVYMAKKNFIYKLMAKIAILKSDIVTSNSPQLLDDLENIKQIQKKAVVYYGVDTAYFHPDTSKSFDLRKQLGFNKKDLIILCVGRLVEKKGIRYLIKALPKINDKVKLLIVGDGDQKENLVKLSNQLKVKSRCTFAGTINYSELPDYYNLSDIFILPSIRDSNGNLDDQSVSVAEAMSCGKPVVVTDLPGYRTLLESEDNGLFIKEKDSQSITKQINKLALSQSLRRKLGNNSRKISLNKLRWKKIGKQYLCIYQEIINE